MPEPITVTLAEHWRVYLDGLVQSGRFTSTDDAIESSLRLLEAVEHEDDRLMRMLEEGEQSGDAGPWDVNEFLSEMHELSDEREAA